MKRNDITIIRKIGQGANGTCYLVQHNETEQVSVMKQIAIDKMTPKERQYVQEEIKIMKTLTHPNIINFLSFDISGNQVFIFMEYAEFGSLYDLMKLNDVFSENQILIWAHQLFQGLNYLHSMNILH